MQPTALTLPDPVAKPAVRRPPRVYRASVSFEFDLQPVQTVRLEIVALTLHRAAKRAALAAQRMKPGLRPRSLVVVLESTDPQVSA